MPAIVKLRVIAARELPVMDRSSELTDAFVEIRLGQNDPLKTEVRKKTLNPVWNSPWFQFDVKDEELQDEPLQFRVMDYDMYSSHDAIGRVYVPLYLLVDGSSSSPSVLDGWLPIFDTFHGVRGELHIIVSVEMIRDQHRFKGSSSEVMLFSGPEVPCGYYVVAVKGFVEELVVNDDPEYQWIDKIRPPRTSNEARQRLFLKLSGELQRRIGIRAREAGGNSIIGYSQSFDLEGESGIVVRGIGTCVILAASTPLPATHSPQLPESCLQLLQQGSNSMGVAGTDRSVEEMEVTGDVHTSTVNGATPLKHPRVRHTSSTSDVDSPSSPARAGLLAPGVGGDASVGSTTGFSLPLPLGMVNPGSSEFPFYTLAILPSGFVRNIAGIVSARSVKLLDDINNPDQPETRDAWWQEVRSEVRSHSRTLGCNAVIGYSETTSICDGLCIFSASGTAAVVAVTQMSPSITKKVSQDRQQEDDAMASVFAVSGGGSDEESSQSVLEESPLCGPCHLTTIFSKSLAVDKRKVVCSVCKSNLVPTVLLSTAGIPAGLVVRGEGCLIQTRVCKTKKRGKGEENASNVSSTLPFLEYSLHGRLMHKLKVKGMNAVFGVKVQVVAGDTMVIGIATGTAVYLEALPPPTTFSRQGKESVMPMTSQLSDFQAALDELQAHNRTRFSLDKPSALLGMAAEATPLVKFREVSPEIEGMESDSVFHKGKQCVVETDDQPLKVEDLTEMRIDQNLPEGFHLSNLPYVPGFSEKLSDDSKLVAMVHKQILDPKLQRRMDEQFTYAMSKVLQGLLFRVRWMHPCVLTNVTFEVDLPDDDEVQIQVVAMATKIASGGVGGDEALAKPATSKPSPSHEKKPPGRSESPERLFFPMESSEDDAVEKKALKNTFGSIQSVYSKEEIRTGPVPMTPLPQLPGQNCPAHLGIINLFLIKESTSVKEGGGLHSFLRTFFSEAHAVVRAHVVALGGSVLLNYRLRQCIITENAHKNQAQCLLNVTGDVRAVRSSRGKVTDPAVMQLDPLRPLELPESPSVLTRRTSKTVTTASGLAAMYSSFSNPAFQSTEC